MKNIFKFFAVLAACASLASCVKYAEYTTVPFVSVNSSSLSIEESADGATLTLPINVYNATSDCSVTYEVKDLTAKQGLDYTVVGGSGVLNFPVGTTSQDVTFNVSGQPGHYTGDVKFQVIIKSATNDVTIGSYDTCTITIVDKDHPLLSMFGTYTYKSLQLDDETEALTYYSWKTMTISPYDGDPTKIWIDKLFVLQLWYPSYLPNGGGRCYANVSKDMKTITIPVPQDFHTSPVNLFGVDEEFWIYKCNSDEFITDDDEIVFTLQEDGSYKTEDDFGLNTPNKVANGLFYYGINAFSSADSAKPTYFKKN